MIKRIEVIGLNNRQNFCYDFNSDLNILTGRNGVGKTTLLKLIWYMMSANRELILSEISFDSARLITDKFDLSISNERRKAQAEMLKSVFRYCEQGGTPVEREIVHDNGIMSDEDKEFIGDLNRRADFYSDETIFFPTFRRIEGGFAIENRRRRMGFGHAASRSLSDGMEEYSRAMSSLRHTFVASISTEDIEDLLMRKYAEISEKTNSMYLDFSKFIRTKLEMENNGDSEDAELALRFREEIKKRHYQVNENREKLMKPFDTLADLIRKVFKDKGIQISQSLTLGIAKVAIRARILSAGEKQMFSFLSYNAFAKDSVIFIDEPELSLHVDWQRILFKMMLSQGSSNQFIITTHSPFIYSAYPEKELVIDTDKGV